MIYLRPKESVHVPLKYQTFSCQTATVLQVSRGSVQQDRSDQILPTPCLNPGSAAKQILYFSIPVKSDLVYKKSPNLFVSKEETGKVETVTIKELPVKAVEPL